MDCTEGAKTLTSCFVPTFVCWGGSRGGSVEPPKLNVKMYSKRVVKKKVNQLI